MSFRFAPRFALSLPSLAVQTSTSPPAPPLTLHTPTPTQTPLTGPADAPLASLGVHPGDPLYSAGPAPPPPPPPPPLHHHPLVARGLTPRGAALLRAAASGVPARLRAALEEDAPTDSVPTAIAAAAHACLLEAGWAPAWGGTAAAPASSLPPDWAPALASPPLAYAYGAGAAVRLEVRVFDLGAFTVVAGATTGGEGVALQVAIRTADHAAPGAPAPPPSDDACPPLVRVRELIILLADGLASPLARAAAAAAAASSTSTSTSPSSLPALPRPPTGLLDLPPHLLASEILARLAGADLARCACVARPLAAAAEDDAPWAAALAREWGASQEVRGRVGGGGGRLLHLSPRAAFKDLASAQRRAAAVRGAAVARLGGLGGRVGQGQLWPGRALLPFPPWVPGGGGGPRRPGGVLGGDFDRRPPGMVGGLFGAVGGGPRAWRLGQPR